jgi:hypothetical protein
MNSPVSEDRSAMRTTAAIKLIHGIIVHDD